jgi:23S rRNA U2552 (ribose-2'-O)-methylase RlmE/FtsJ
MSWPTVKPPWKNVSWFNSILNSWPQPPMIEYKEHTTCKISDDLEALKMTIEELDKINEWEFLKRSSNPYELVFSQSQDPRIPPSISNLKPLSRSFFKMVEILYVLNFFERNSKPQKRSIVQSAHVCEGPGGFIEALIYTSYKKSCMVENVTAITLKPTKTNIPGWKRAYHFLRKSPMVHIEYGADETGDIMVPVNQASFLDKTRNKCHIFTADGGFDFSEHYSTQEEEVFPLLISSALIGLQTLVKGGDFVLKVFDIELESTRNLLAILAHCFDKWTLYKPSLSRPCNAEKYFLGSGCKIIPLWIINVLSGIRDSYNNGNKPIKSFFSAIPEDIDNDLNMLQKEYLQQQIAALNYTILHKNEWNKQPDVIWKSIRSHSTTWCREFNIPIKISVASRMNSKGIDLLE